MWMFNLMQICQISASFSSKEFLSVGRREL